MKTPSQIIRERIGEEKNKMFLAYCGNPAVLESRAITWLLHELLPLIEEYEANSVEKLLEEIGYSATLVNMKTYWVAQTTNSSQSGATPQEALQKLREALT